MSISLSTSLQNSGIHRLWVFPVLGELGRLVAMLGSGKCSRSCVPGCQETCSWVN